LVEQPAIAVKLFGGLKISVGGAPLERTRTKKERYLLALLALRNGQPIDRERISCELWPDSLPDQARSNLRRSLYNLGQALGPSAERLYTRSGEIGFDFSDSYVDVVDFDESVKCQTPDGLRRAVRLHSAPLMPHCEEDWARRERSQRLEEYFGAVDSLSLWTAPSEAANLLKTALQLDPTREAIVRKLILALRDSGNSAAALDLFNGWAQRLEREFGSKPSSLTVELAANLRARDANRKPAQRRTVLPSYGTKFFGREAEIARLSAAIRESVQVNLTGPPGIGKSRLAVEFALRLRDDFSDGVFFVDARRANSESLTERCWAAMESGGIRPEDSLPALLKRKNTLLVIDDADTTSPKVVAFLASLSDRFSRSRVLVTSRTAVTVAGGLVCPIGPLEIESRETISSPAIGLFLDRTQIANPDFAFSSANLDAAKRICRRLGGLPLAIEIVAAWADTLPLAKIEGRLGMRLALETPGPSSNHCQEKTIRAAFEECLENLTAQELELLKWCAIFANGWTLAALVAASALGEERVAVGLRALIHKSLVMRRSDTGRYQMLEVTREVVLERVGADAREASERRLAFYFRDLVLALEETPDRFFDDLPDLGMLNERVNLEAALDWWRRHDPETAVQLEFLLSHWRVIRLANVREWIQRLSVGERPWSAIEPMMLAHAGIGAFWGELPCAYDLLERAAITASAAGIHHWEAHAQNFLSLYFQRIRRYDEAERCEHAGEMAGRRAGMRFFVELSSASQAYMRWKQGFEGGLDWLRDQLLRGETTGNWRASYAALRGLAAVALETRDFETALDMATKLAVLARQHCRHEVVNVLLWCATAATEQSEFQLARDCLSEALEVGRERGEIDREAAVYEKLAVLEERQLNLEKAEAHLAQACKLLETGNHSGSLAKLLVRRSEIAGKAGKRENARVLLEWSRNVCAI
jgi:DNA-binding SARP family transcriptional activator/predicted ATPase